MLNLMHQFIIVFFCKHTQGLCLADVKLGMKCISPQLTAVNFSRPVCLLVTHVTSLELLMLLIKLVITSFEIISPYHTYTNVLIHDLPIRLNITLGPEFV
jgi:hypothetical protein